MELDHNNIYANIKADGYIFQARLTLNGLELTVFEPTNDGDVDVVAHEKVSYSSIDADTGFFNNVLENT